LYSPSATSRGNPDSPPSPSYPPFGTEVLY
jgi:hypothetical protein